MTSSKSYICAGLALVAAAALAGCNRPADTRLPLIGKSYCTPFRTVAATSNAASSPNGQSGLATSATLPAADPGAALDDCVHRWAYALAPSRDPADIVAHAAIDACSAIVTTLSQQAAPAASDSNATQDDQQQDQQQAENPIAQQMRATEGKALFYVVQARAAGCAPPPANSLPAN
jgi:hypothetical protein